MGYYKRTDMTALASSIPDSPRDGRQRFGAAHTIVEQAIRDRVFPGAAYGILLDGEVVALDAAGQFTYEPRLRM